jgi:exodeoxyribonuclease V alpha subunit
VRYLSVAELPPHEPCFAMTVHKSQGSEYATLVVAVVPALDSPLLTRELVYTALTRAKQRAVVVGSRDAIEQSLSRTARRTSGISWLIEQLLARH